MKKVLLFAVVGGFLALTSCKKDYTCTINLLGVESVVEYNDLNKSEADDAKAACEAATGTWATK